MPLVRVDPTASSEGDRRIVTAEHRALYLGLPVVMCLTDAAGRLIEVSDEWLEHLGGTRETILGTPFVEILAEAHRERAAAAIGAGSVDALAVDVRDAEGERVEHAMSCRTRGLGTLAERRLIVLNDVSARNRATRELEARNRELAHANENLNRFAFVASHDLQEPLRKIRQFSDFLLEDDGDALSDDGRHHLKVIVEAATRMSTLIRGLLQYSRASRNVLERREVELDAVLAQARSDLELPLAESAATLRIAPLPSVTGDPVLLLQLFTNLLANAVKYRERSRALVVEVRHERAGGESRVVVADNGIGFDPSYRTKVFEPFTRLHGPKDYQGSGIGLAICATVCRQHGWRIEAESRAGRGSTFVVAIEPGDAARAGPPPETGHGDGTRSR